MLYRVQDGDGFRHFEASDFGAALAAYKVWARKEEELTANDPDPEPESICCVDEEPVIRD